MPADRARCMEHRADRAIANRRSGGVFMCGIVGYIGIEDNGGQARAHGRHQSAIADLTATDSMFPERSRSGCAA